MDDLRGLRAELETLVLEDWEGVWASGIKSIHLSYFDAVLPIFKTAAQAMRDRGLPWYLPTPDELAQRELRVALLTDRPHVRRRKKKEERRKKKEKEGRGKGGKSSMDASNPL